MEHEAILWEPAGEGRVRCRVCRRRCVIPPGGRGFCRVRENRGGRLVALTYGRVAALHVAPIEVKPLFHFYPGTMWLSVGSLGCNFRCPGCQNWQIAHAEPGEAAREIEPGELVELAVRHGCKGLSWTYNEPTVWLEYTIDAGRKARERGLLANYVTNGFATPEALEAVAPYLDAYRVDIKAFDTQTYRRLANTDDLDGVLDSALRAKRLHGLHVECVTNVVPGYNDAPDQLRALARWISTELGPDTPWHVTRFIPHLDLSDVPATPVATLERARSIGLAEGLRFVYLGNVPGHEGENTWCDGCGALLIERGRGVVKNRLRDGHCPECDRSIPGRWA